MNPEDKKKLDALRLLEQKKTIRDELPFKYQYKDYEWSKEFIESRNRLCFLTAANQIGKSVSQIRKMILWATTPEIWPSLWRSRPNLFWYFYPSKDLAQTEYETKWKYLLPQGSMKDDPIYGWTENLDNKKISSIKFNSGILLVFKTYAQDAQNLQAGSCFYIGIDEEPPADILPELLFRVTATGGHISAVFTATLSQEYFRLVMEERGEYEKFPEADKWQISRYDCLRFADGTESHWTEKSIKDDIARCSTDAEVQMRIFGKFVTAEGRIFPEFSLKKNVRFGGPIPRDWLIYAGIDYGSGGEKNHPAAIAFVAVKPDFTQGRVVRAWRGDGIQTDATAILLRYVAMKNELKSLGLSVINTRYDQSCRDLLTISTRMNEPIQAAEKSHDVGLPILNSLFKNQILYLDEEQNDVMKLAFELSNLLQATPKTRAKDDMADATRYAVTLVPWNWTVVQSADGKPDSYEEPPKPESEADQRRAWVREAPPLTDDMPDFEEMNELYGN